MKTTLIVNLGLVLIAYAVVGNQPQQLIQFFSWTFGFSLIAREMFKAIKI